MYDDDDDSELNIGFYCDPHNNYQCNECLMEASGEAQELIDMFKTQLALNVKRGVYALDEQFPGWREKVVVDELDLSNGESCILGQLYGGYSVGQRQLGLYHEAHASYQHGFDLTGADINFDGNSHYAWRALDQLWTEHIESDR